MPVRQSLIAFPRRLTIHNPQRHRPRVVEGAGPPLFTKTLRFLRLSSFQTVLWCTSSVYRSELVSAGRGLKRIRHWRKVYLLRRCRAALPASSCRRRRSHPPDIPESPSNPMRRVGTSARKVSHDLMFVMKHRETIRPVCTNLPPVWPGPMPIRHPSEVAWAPPPCRFISSTARRQERRRDDLQLISTRSAGLPRAWH